MDHLLIPMESDDASWKERCSQRLEELKNTQSTMHNEFVRGNKYMSSELYEAVASGNNVDDFVNKLMQECKQRKSSDIFDQVTGTGDSLLHVASEKGKERIAELICDHFPKLLFMTNIRGDTVLHAAVKSENSEVVKLILSQYATAKLTHDEIKDKEITRETNKHGDTPLHKAVFCGNVDVVKELIHADQEVIHYLNKAKQSPLYLAAVTKKNEEILNHLLEIPFPEVQQLCLGNSPLHAAILQGNHDLITRILEKRPELVYLKDEDGNTSFHYAAYQGYAKVFDILLKTPLNKLDQIALEGNNKGHLPIHLACKRGHLSLVEKFLEAEWPIDPLVLNGKGQNILHVAAKNGRTNIVRYLLRDLKINQLTINWKDNDGNTPLHLASLNLFPKVMLLFVKDRNTDVNLLNNKGLTALDTVLASESRLTCRKVLAKSVLETVAAKANDKLISRHQQPLNSDFNSKDITNTYLLVATLMMTVTFAAAITVPGGLHSSEDPDLNSRGLAVLAEKPLFTFFTVFNMISMFSSLIACGVMLMSFVFYQKLAAELTIAAGGCLVLAFFSAPVAFMAATWLVLPNNSKRSLLITIIGIPYSILAIWVLPAIHPIFKLNRTITPRRLRQGPFEIVIAFTNYVDKPKESSSGIKEQRQG